MEGCGAFTDRGFVGHRFYLINTVERKRYEERAARGGGTGHRPLWSRPVGISRRAKEGHEKDKASIWMKSKLQLSQNILEGLTRGDFDMISKNSKAMNYLGYIAKMGPGQPGGLPVGGEILRGRQQGTHSPGR